MFPFGNILQTNVKLLYYYIYILRLFITLLPSREQKYIRNKLNLLKIEARCVKLAAAESVCRERKKKFKSISLRGRNNISIIRHFSASRVKGMKKQERDCETNDNPDKQWFRAPPFIYERQQMIPLCRTLLESLLNGNGHAILKGWVSVVPET